MVEAGHRVVAIFGGSEARPGDALYKAARRVGRILAESGYTVANGGYGGLMEATARGAKDGGGRTIGVTCSIWRSAPNRYVDRVITAADVFERVRALIELGRGGYVVLPGATGTLEEFATAWNLLMLRQLQRRPLVCVGLFWRPLLAMMATARTASAECVAVIEDPEELRRHFPGFRTD